MAPSYFFSIAKDSRPAHGYAYLKVTVYELPDGNLSVAHAEIAVLPVGIEARTITRAIRQSFGRLSHRLKCSIAYHDLTFPCSPLRPHQAMV